MLGRDMRREMPASDALVAPLILGICYGNAKKFLGLGVA